MNNEFNDLPVLNDRKRVKAILLSYISTMGMTLQEAAEHFGTDIKEQDGTSFISVFVNEDMGYQIHDVMGDLQISPVVVVVNNNKLDYYFLPDLEDIEAIKKNWLLDYFML